MEIYSSLIEPDEADTRDFHIIITNQLIGSMDFPEKRYHARVGWFSIPSIISAPAISIAPARSRKYHLARRMGIKGEVTDDDHIAHGDKRITEVIKGLALQAISFYMTGDAFCENRDCRLFNAHTQADMIHAQLRPEATLCPKHEKMLMAD